MGVRNSLNSLNYGSEFRALAIEHCPSVISASYFRMAAVGGGAGWRWGALSQVIQELRMRLEGGHFSPISIRVGSRWANTDPMEIRKIRNARIRRNSRTSPAATGPTPSHTRREIPPAAAQIHVAGAEDDAKPTRRHRQECHSINARTQTPLETARIGPAPVDLN